VTGLTMGDQSRWDDLRRAVAWPMAGEPWIAGDSAVTAAWGGDGRGRAAIARSTWGHHGAYIAAASPATIRALLADRDAAVARAEAAEALAYRLNSAGADLWNELENLRGEWSDKPTAGLIAEFIDRWETVMAEHDATRAGARAAAGSETTEQP
jgi:hypothetical protein